MGLGFLGVGFFGSCLSWVLLVHCILDCVPRKRERPNVIWAQASILIIWNFFYNLTIGPVGFSILCETSAAHVREKTIAFSTAVQAFVGIGMTIAVPYTMINPDQADMGGKIGFFFGGLATLSCFWAFLRIPETVSYGCSKRSHCSPLRGCASDRVATNQDAQKNRTYEELDIMFARGIRARDFSRYIIS
jgi:MFS transporter, SP family, general alpha glucoside:H+ symporter